ncbi:MAG: RNA polymerase sigma factor RpoH [Rickettsiales bacterium]|jgi:RNA polymerase sigma-32 factor|nr:RNA polymerase sigma factor RpoH [Rickettsiales bacterium]
MANIKPVDFSLGGGVPSVVLDGGISSYINMVKSIPHLSAEDEFRLARRVQEDKDLKAAEELIKSNLYLVVAAAFEYRGYGLPMSDIISEGNIGLMKAVRKYDPDRGFRLSTYALWWIRATINEFVLSSWSLVKIGTAAAQKKLFFGLKKLKARLGIYHDNDLSEHEVRQISQKMDVTAADVREMNARLQRDSSLNKTIGEDGEAAERVEMLADAAPLPEEHVASNEVSYRNMKMLFEALDTLNERERSIIQARRLMEEPRTLDDIAAELGISKERVRQIEARAMEKLTAALKGRHDEDS